MVRFGELKRRLQCLGGEAQAEAEAEHPGVDCRAIVNWAHEIGIAAVYDAS